MPLLLRLGALEAPMIASARIRVAGARRTDCTVFLLFPDAPSDPDEAGRQRESEW